MKIIMKLCDHMEEELRSSENYINCAIKFRDDFPEASSLWYSLSIDEMQHADHFHSIAEDIISKYNGEVDSSMSEVYEYLHRKMIDWKSRIVAKQDYYKSK